MLVSKAINAKFKLPAECLSITLRFARPQRRLGLFVPRLQLDRGLSDGRKRLGAPLGILRFARGQRVFGLRQRAAPAAFALRKIGGKK